MRLIQTLALAGALCLSVSGVALMAAQAEVNTPAENWAPETFTLKNGMEIVVLPDHRAPVVTHMVWYRVGAADEDPGKSGIAHLFEHLMFKATDEIPAGEFSKIVARNGGQDNAFTSWDYTAYYQRIAKDRLPTMMRLEANRMTNLILDDEQVLPERDVVKEERRQRIENNPGAILFEDMMAALYGDHPYGIPVIGHMDEVAALTREDAVEFYGKWYAPERTTLVVAGDITAAELRPLAEETYGVIQPKGSASPREWPAVPPLSESVILTHSDPKVRQESWDEYWQGTSYSIVDAGMDPHALDIATQIIGGGRTSRLYQALVEEQKIAVEAYAGAWTSLKAGGPVYVGASPARGISLDEVSVATHKVIDDFLETGPTEEELVRAKSNLVASAIFQRDSQSSMAQTYGAASSRGDSLDSIATWPDEIKAITAEQVRTTLAKYVKDKPSVTTKLLVPEN
jgi:zinc protease